MAKGANYTVNYRRKREGKTDYKKRLNLLKSGKCRLVVRRSNTSILTQIVKYEEEGDRIMVSANSKELRKYNWNFSCSNISAAYLTGYLCGKKCQIAGIKNAILDTGLQQPVKGSRIYAALKGVIDSGVVIPHDNNIFPSIERLYGEHIHKDIKKEVERIKRKFDEENVSRRNK